MTTAQSHMKTTAVSATLRVIRNSNTRHIARYLTPHRTYHHQLVAQLKLK